MNRYHIPFRIVLDVYGQVIRHTFNIDNSLENISLVLDTNLCSGNSIELIQTSNDILNWLGIPRILPPQLKSIYLEFTI